MKEKKYSISIPEKIINELHLEDESEVRLKIIENKIMMVEPVKRKIGNQTVSLRWFMIPTIFSSLCFFLYVFLSGNKLVPLVGSFSIANLVTILGSLSGICSFFFFFVQEKKDRIKGTSKDIYWRNFPTILSSFVIILVMSLVAFFKVMGLIFKGAGFDLFTATLLFFAFVAIVNYFMIYSALSITPSKLTNLLIFVIVAGVFVAMITNRENQWWQFNFSFLGTAEAKYRWEFNLTLLFSALLMIALIDYIFVGLQNSFQENKKLLILRVLLTLTAIDLGAVGLFPYTEIGPFVGFHNQAAGILVYLIIILIVGIRWLLPEVTKEFLTISYLIGAVLVITLYLFIGVGYLSLTAFELLSFILAFAWILLLVQLLQKMAEEGTHSFIVKLEKK